MKGLRHIMISFALVLLGISACDCHTIDPVDDTYDQVDILYSVGRNTLDNFLISDIEDLASGNLPSKNGKKVMLVISQNFFEPSDTRGVFDSNPYLIRLYRDKGVAVMDTLKAFPARSTEGIIQLLTDPSVMTSIISSVCDMFKSKHYGLICSSHGSGWIPNGFYNRPVVPSAKAKRAPLRSESDSPALPEGAHPYVPIERDPSLPLTKSFGEQLFIDGLSPMSLEMDIRAFADALPIHFDYIAFDACLMGTIEVAYELKDACDLLLFSPAEILTEGFDYVKLADRLFGGEKPDVKGIAEDYFNYYNAQSGDERSATITLVDCRHLDELASLCKSLFGKYQNGIAEVDPSRIGHYFSLPNRKWFYDLEDILNEAGISDTDRSELEGALEKVADYRAATEKILGFIDVDVYSGFGMYLPCAGSDYLDDYYRTLAWNKATGLVK